MSTGFARVWGQGPDPALLLHCSLAHAAAWAGMAAKLTDRLHMIAPDLVGHGRAPDHDPSRDYHDQATAEALTHLPDRPCHLIGHSFGATVALRIAIDHPERVRSLTLIEPMLFAAAAEGPGKRENDAVFAALAPAFAAQDHLAAARGFMAVWGDGTPFDALRAGQKTYIRPRMPLIAASNPALQDDAARLLPRIGQVTCPVLMLAGSASPQVIHDIQDGLAARLPTARRAVVAGAGHMLPITHPTKVAAQIRAFLDS